MASSKQGLRDGQSEKEIVVVVGAGPAGCVVAMQLARRGFAVKVFEERAERQVLGDISHDRTFIMSLSSRWVQYPQVPIPAVY